MQNKKLQFIKYAMLTINCLAVLFVVIFLYDTTTRICDFYIAREFIETVDAIPHKPGLIMFVSIILLGMLVLSFVIREYIYPKVVQIEFGSLIFDFVISMTIVVLSDFNYNGILLWVFANVISHIGGQKGRYLFMFLAIVSFLGTDYELVSINYNMYSINDYIGYYNANTQQYFRGIYNLLISLNMIIFIVFCIYVIQEQRGTIEEVNSLYDKLSETNNELQNANVQLQKYAIMKEKMGETRERNRLAREIHDTLGHTLTGISAGIDACITTIDQSPDSTKKQLEVISKVTREGITEIRRSVSQLRPDALERLSLEYAIKKMITDMNEVSSIQVYFDCQVEHLKFDEDEENIIYRIIQESITNSIRHGKAHQIWIVIQKKEGDIHLIIKDDGIGCKEIKKGFGTTHIAERIQLLNGTVSFHGENGFTTKVMIPIRWGEEYD